MNPTPRLYRVLSGRSLAGGSPVGVYEAVERLCPRGDERREGKPDGSWLTKAGPTHAGAISFWTRAGLARYEASGLRNWHESIVGPTEILLAPRPREVFYEDELQLLCMPSAITGPLTVRLAREGEAAGIARVHVQAWQETYAGLIPAAYLAALTPEQRLPQWQSAIEHAARAGARHRLWVAVDGAGTIVGFAVGGAARANADHGGATAGNAPAEDAAEIYAIYLLRAHQGTGAGALLFRELARALAALGFARAGLWVLERNPTRAFYERLGGQLREGAVKPVEIGGAAVNEVSYEWALPLGSREAP